jgi:uncharacterized membrane protein YhaH (DUF805 family)
MSGAWYYANAGEPVGPLTLQEIRSTLQSVPHWRDALVWHDGLHDWQRAGSLPEFVPPPLPSATPAEKTDTSATDSLPAASKTKVIKLLFGFNGRQNRARYWLICLICLVWLSGGALLVHAAPIGNEYIAIYGSLAWIVVLIWVGLANLVKRLHDIDASGWWVILILGVGPTINMVSSFLGQSGQRALTGVSLLVAVSITAILGGVEGTVGKNRFGPDPARRDN